MTGIQYTLSLVSTVLPIFVSSLSAGDLALLFYAVELPMLLLAISAQAFMAGGVVSTGSASMKGCWDGARRFFWRVVAAELVIGVIGGLLTISIFIGIGLASNWGGLFLSPLILAISYIFLAPTILHNLKLRSSIRYGAIAARKNWRAFLVLVGLGFLLNVFAYGTSVMIAMLATQTNTSLVYAVEWIVGLIFSLPIVLSSPLLMLIAFRIYYESHAAQAFRTQNSQRTIRNMSEDATVCMWCGERMPQVAKYCPNCGRRAMH